MSSLDDAYANAPYIAGAEHYHGRWQAEAAEMRARLGDRALLGLSYGPSERQAFDLFLPTGAPKGTVIFVHGGYWLKFDRSYWSHLARGPLEQGWAVAMPSYDLCPEVRIATITQQIALAVQKIAARQAGPISLTGHSAGGHLVARMCAPGMLPNQIRQRLHHVMPISGLSDLEPLLQTEMNTEFGMDLEMARAESPLLQPAPDLPVTLWVGGAERPSFLDQTFWLSEAWSCPQIVAPHKHHFDVIDALADPDSDMVARLTR